MNLSYDLTKIIIILTLFNLSHHQLLFLNPNKEKNLSYDSKILFNLSHQINIFLSPNEKDQRLRAS